ncbi:phosphotransferase family protein [Peterkaempfera bronchialis]|uniref:phosphotransferase family protein n=1 Tax=Peterkaempfera bronchialis TaxID=2126346 RepID=UPI003C2D84D9
MAYAWDDLPADLRASIQLRTGHVTKAVPPTAGTVSDYAATLDTATGPVFCKAIRTDNSRAWMHRREAAVSPSLPNTAAALHWSVEVAGWLALGFEHIPGRHADLSPGSGDLPLITRTLGQLADALTPAPPLRGFTLAERWSGQDYWQTVRERHPDRLGPWTAGRLDALVTAEREAPGLIDGRTLAHTDLTGSNILISGGTARVIDWAFPAPGAPWVDTAYLVVRLIGAGHTPAEAEQWAARLPLWREASPWAVTAFGATLAGLWTLRSAEQPGRQWDILGAHGLTWLRHRLG